MPAGAFAQTHRPATGNGQYSSGLRILRKQRYGGHARHISRSRTKGHQMTVPPRCPAGRRRNTCAVRLPHCSPASLPRQPWGPSHQATLSRRCLAFPIYVVQRHRARDVLEHQDVRRLMMLCPALFACLGYVAKVSPGSQRETALYVPMVAWEHVRRPAFFDCPSEHFSQRSASARKIVSRSGLRVCSIDPTQSSRRTDHNAYTKSTSAPSKLPCFWPQRSLSYGIRRAPVNSASKDSQRVFQGGKASLIFLVCEDEDRHTAFRSSVRCPR